MMPKFQFRRRNAFDLPAHYLLGVAIAIIPWLVNRSFYFHDDLERQFLEAYYYIGSMLRDGQLPVLTLETFYAGNLLGEHQYGVFNPINLVLFTFLPSIKDYRLAGLFLACFHYGVLVSGAFKLARSFKIEKEWASLIALSIGCSNFLSYWFASTWFPAFISFAWFMWAWAALRCADAGRLEWFLAAIFCFLTIASGYPQTTLALAAVALVLIAAKWRHGRVAAGAVALAFASGVILNAIPLSALMALGEISGRARGFINNNYLVPNLHDVLALSSPFHDGFVKGWGGYGHALTPMFYAAWFLIPVLPLINWRRKDSLFRELVPLSVIACIFLVLSQGPEVQNFMRYPFRWLPFFQVPVICMFCLVASELGFVRSKSRLIMTAGLLVLTLIWSLQVAPEHWRSIVLGIALCAAGAGLFACVVYRRAVIQTSIIGIVTVAVFAVTHVVIPRNLYVGSWGVPPTAAKNVRLSDSEPLAYSIFLTPVADTTDPNAVREIRTGLIQLGLGKAILYGASGIEHSGLRAALCMDSYGNTCPDAAHRLFEIDGTTQKPLVDLFRIDRITAMKGEYLDALRAHLTSSWNLDYDGVITQRYVRDLPSPVLPGTLASVPETLKIEEHQEMTALSEIVRIKNDAQSPALVVYCRLWWPGYKAYIDGVEIPINAFRGVFVSVLLPPGASGNLELRYRPPFLRTGLILTLSILVLMLLVPSMLARRRRSMLA